MHKNSKLGDGPSKPTRQGIGIHIFLLLNLILWVICFDKRLRLITQNDVIIYIETFQRSNNLLWWAMIITRGY